MDSLRENKTIRGRGKHTSDYGMKDLWRWYRKNTHPSLRVTDEKLYSRLIRDFNKALLEHMTVTAQHTKINGGLGTLGVIKQVLTNRKKRPIDFKTSYDLGIKLFHLNPDRGDTIYRWKWTKNKGPATSQYCRFYTYRPCRIAKRTLAKVLKTRPEIDFYSNK